MDKLIPREMKLALIGCTAVKHFLPCKARQMYQPSQLFKKAWKYIQQQGYDHTAILSAKYGFLNPDQNIEPYNLSLNGYSSTELKQWSKEVSSHIIELKPSEVHFYCGQRYRKYVIPELEELGITCIVPLKGLGIGQQLKYYNDRG